MHMGIILFIGTARLPIQTRIE
jgi:hypothetical protein